MVWRGQFTECLSVAMSPSLRVTGELCSSPLHSTADPQAVRLSFRDGHKVQHDLLAFLYGPNPPFQPYLRLPATSHPPHAHAVLGPDTLSSLCHPARLLYKVTVTTSSAKITLSKLLNHKILELLSSHYPVFIFSYLPVP